MGKPDDEKVRTIEARIAAAMRGLIETIDCPYCGAENKSENASLCCEDFGLVVRAVLRKHAQGDVIDQAARIADKAASMGLLN